MERFKYFTHLVCCMVEENAFLEFVGDTPTTRLIDFLITGREFDYTLTDLTNKAGVSWTTLHRIFPSFIKNKIVVEVRQIGRAKLYKLNESTPLVKKFIELYDCILLTEMNKHNKKKVKVELTT